jgi:signal transduction histidine kinase/CheY-like chemotaxis protein
VQEIKDGLYPFLDSFYSLYSGGAIRAYGMVDGQIISNESNIEGQDNYDYEGTNWYEGALAANGEIYMTDAYRGQNSGLLKMTFALKAAHSDSVLAFDVYFWDYHARDTLDLPEGGCYYLCDAQGTVIYADSVVYDSYDKMQAYADRILAKVADQTSYGYVANYTDAKGETRCAITCQLDNGWTIIVSIPQANTIGNLNSFYLAVGLIFLVGAALVIYWAVRDLRRQQVARQLYQERQEAERTRQLYQMAMHSTMQAYRGVYLVYLDDNAYQIIYPEPTQEDKEKPAVSYETRVSQLIDEGILEADDLTQLRRFLDLKHIRSEMSREEYAELRCRRHTADGTTESCVLTITVAEREGEHITCVTIAIRSIENVIRQEAAQRELYALAAQRAESANHAKSDFLSNMSHDIRTPLNAILGMAAIAAMHVDDRERVIDALGKIATAGRHLLGLINSVLDMSKIESGKLSLNEEEFELGTSVQSLLTVFHSDIQSKGLTLRVRPPEVQHEHVLGDDQRLQQVFVNILGNAVKFTPSGGTITMSIRELPSEVADRGRYEFTFEDTGIGMQPEFVAHIFEPFVRATDSRTSRTDGFGLGMAISYNIAKMMGGGIAVESTPGKGSKFTVTVYLKLNNMTPEDLKQLEQLPVLVVDDEQDACESACQILTGLEMQAEYVLSGDEAVERVKARHQAQRDYSVVILDWRMPGKDGVQTAREIRAVTNGEVPVIILSAYDWSEIESEATLAGVNAFVEKPLFRSRLVHVLQEVLGLNRARQVDAVDAYRSHDYSGKRVLLVEDNELNSEVAGELLSVVGVEVEYAYNGKEAVGLLERQEPGYYDLVLMDIQMPVMNGYEATRAIRSSDREDLRKLPIVAMTADAFVEDVEKARHAGMNGHIAKPVDLPKLEAVLKEWL